MNFILFSEQDIDTLLFNDKIAMKVVEELEEWKEKQQEIFRDQVGCVLWNWVGLKFYVTIGFAKTDVQKEL